MSARGSFVEVGGVVAVEAGGEVWEDSNREDAEKIVVVEVGDCVSLLLFMF